MTPESITCPECGMTSWNPSDIREGYCGNCHAWTSRTDWAPPDCGHEIVVDHPESDTSECALCGVVL